MISTICLDPDFFQEILKVLTDGASVSFSGYIDLPGLVVNYNQGVAGNLNADVRPLTLQERQEWFLEHGPDHHPIYILELEESIIGWER